MLGSGADGSASCPSATRVMLAFPLHVFTCTTCYTDSVDETQNLTLRLSVATLKKVRIAAAKRGTSISALVAEKIEEIAGDDEAYEAAKRHALQLLQRGFHLGGRAVVRETLHER